MKSKYSSDFLSVFLRDSLQKVQVDIEAQGRESVQSTVWLVGLSSAVLAYIAGNPAVLKALLPGWAATAVILLAGSIIVGVAQRMTYWIAEAKQRVSWSSLNGLLAGMTLETFPMPQPFDVNWSRQTLANELKRVFDINEPGVQDPETDIQVMQSGSDPN